MKKLIYIHCYFREESRTKRLASSFLHHLKKDYEIIHYDVNDFDLTPMSKDSFGEEPNQNLFWVTDSIKNADVIVLACPFYDMGLPGRVRTFLEKISIPNIMFLDDKKVTCHPLLDKKPSFYYITTRGMPIESNSSQDGASFYLKALSTLWGFQYKATIGANNLDYSSPKEIEERLQTAVEEGLKIFQENER